MMSTTRHSLQNTKMNGNSSIPLRRSLSRQGSSPVNGSKIPVNDPQAHRWKQKYEESEERRKQLLTEKEKALRSLSEYERIYLNLQIKHENLETELFEKNEEFTRLSTASKNLYKEYETLKNQYETETRAMSGALKDASQWYKENKQLKRKTLLLMDKDADDEGVDAGDGESNPDNDIENLNRTIKQLSVEVAELQTEVDSLKQQEFQTTEENVKISEELESEKQKTSQLESALNDLKKEHDQLLRILDMMKIELEDYKKLEEEHRNNLNALRKEADGYKRDRNVLKHQSTLILQGLNENSEGNDIVLLQEIEDLKRTLEEERNRHDEEITALQERLEDQETNPQLEILEERLKIVESELQSALERAERAEEKLRAPPPPPPPPPPPMMPPPPPMGDQPPTVPLRRRRSKVALADLAESVGVDRDNGEKKATAAGIPCGNEDIINAIKAGQFTLRKAKNDEKKNKEQPKAVSELLNILGSLRRAPKKRQSQYIGDVQL